MYERLMTAWVAKMLFSYLSDMKKLSDMKSRLIVHASDEEDIG